MTDPRDVPPTPVYVTDARGLFVPVLNSSPQEDDRTDLPFWAAEQCDLYPGDNETDQ